MMSEEMKVLISTAEMMRVGMEALGIEFSQENGEWVATKKQKTKRASKEIGYTPDFLKFKDVYPARKPAPNWPETFACWNQRVREGQYTEDMIKGAERYAKYIRAEGKEFTGFVKQPSTFLGTQRHYLCDWDIPNKPLNKTEIKSRESDLRSLLKYKIPASLVPLELKLWAKEHGYDELGELKPGSQGLEQISRWKAATQKQIDQRIKEELR